ncbi:glycoside hydrolase family 76 protein [Cyberlindnera jadinii NRRL Y-1542]|uniref:mannan endo-1,6-alpha-mannosidase n=1 Tax=Cyberlindnera jadinii (strain ATCC 18201 / CBS 1600 / BCRC 20928 / JCM 3617 / NBRC 0987 / NRRL Y-1542) TaxID=983966 RepID=A0A1E4RUF1_CYBJN|nr:glycoside hydrolase [Cyberlindnera jadinii NRRL Y-1542]ODV70909.1 glycoside hydrolase [Cyberlindnera jadinii NRRL Y-1542]
MISLLALLPFLQFTVCIPVQDATQYSLCSNAKVIASDAMNYRSSDGTFESAYWWQAGEAYNSLLNYQHICGDTQFEDDIYNGMMAQVGSDFNFQPEEHVWEIGNDDIGTWALAAMQAAESGFKQPNDSTTWADVARNSFDLLYSRWDSSTCGGGIRWQFDSSKSGWSYKATIANGNLFQLGARLARYTGDSSYITKAKTVYNWIGSANLFSELQYGTEVYDGFNVEDCSDITKVLWTYNYGILLSGCAYMNQVTGDSEWQDRVSNIILGSQALYNNTILNERACEVYSTCNQDQRIFKGIYLRSLGQASRLLSSLRQTIIDLVSPSINGAVHACTGGASGHECGMKWTINGFDGSYGMQEQISALEVMLTTIAHLSSAMDTAD